MSFLSLFFITCCNLLFQNKTFQLEILTKRRIYQLSVVFEAHLENTSALPRIWRCRRGENRVCISDIGMTIDYKSYLFTCIALNKLASLPLVPILVAFGAVSVDVTIFPSLQVS